MADFTARNGVVIAPVNGTSDEVHGVTIFNPTTTSNKTLTSREATALREKLSADNDRRLGRWRDPILQDYVVYPVDQELGLKDKRVVVFDERSGVSASLYLSTVDRAGVTYDVRAIAKRYLEAHPLPEPWHKAKPGDVWVLNHDVAPGGAWLVYGYESGRVVFYRKDIGEIELTSKAITTARRIWPEA